MIRFMDNLKQTLLKDFEYLSGKDSDSIYKHICNNYYLEHNDYNIAREVSFILQKSNQKKKVLDKIEQ